MIESWVIDRLNPLKTENLIILADPQRMIRAGGQRKGRHCACREITLSAGLLHASEGSRKLFRSAPA
jgi:hypothetical protein